MAKAFINCDGHFYYISSGRSDIGSEIVEVDEDMLNNWKSVLEQYYTVRREMRYFYEDKLRRMYKEFPYCEKCYGYKSEFDHDEEDKCNCNYHATFEG